MYESKVQAPKSKGNGRMTVDDATSRLEGRPADAASVLAVALKLALASVLKARLDSSYV